MNIINMHGIQDDEKTEFLKETLLTLIAVVSGDLDENLLMVKKAPVIDFYLGKQLPDKIWLTWTVDNKTWKILKKGSADDTRHREFYFEGLQFTAWMIIKELDSLNDDLSSEWINHYINSLDENKVPKIIINIIRENENPLQPGIKTLLEGITPLKSYLNTLRTGNS